MNLPYTFASALVIALSLYGLLAAKDLIRRLMAANMMASGIFLYLVLLAARTGRAPDPVPQAMVLTGIVIAVSITAFALALVRWLRAEGKGADGKPGGPQSGAHE